MKNLKKILSLVLVIAMAFSLVAVAGAKGVADYKDASSITRKEAVDVLTALGVLTGDESNNFNPLEDVTREQAAKIMCYIMIGATTADRLPNKASSFKDVDQSRWSNPFIEYCLEKGIIAGYGDGNFGPADKVTGAQFAKMLLQAIGFGAKGEYLGVSWEYKAIEDGVKYGVLTLDNDYTKAAIRQDVAQYTFNAITRAQVVYNTLFNEYYATSNPLLGTATKNSSLGSDVFGLKATYVTDDYGFNSRYWRQSAKTITGLYVTDIIVAEMTITGSTNKGYMAKTYEWDTTGIDLWVNGTNFGAKDTNSAGMWTEGTSLDSSVFALKGSTALPGPTGIVTGVYAYLVDTFDEYSGGYDGTVDKVIAKYEYLAKVTAVNATLGTVSLEVYGAAGTSALTGVVAEGFAKGDFVNIIRKEEPATVVSGVVTDPGIGDVDRTVTQPLSIVKANSVTAPLVSYTNAAGVPAGQINTVATVTIGGTAYGLSAVRNATYTRALDATSFISDLTFYFDSHGNVIGYTAPSVTAGSLNYLYAVDAAGAVASLTTGAAYAKVQAYYTDGKAAVINLPINAAGSYAVVNGTASVALNVVTTLAGKWYSYTVNADGTVNLYDAAGATQALASGQTVATTTARTGVTVGGAAKLATSSTVLTTAIGGVIKTYTGYANFPTMTYEETANQHVLVIYATSGGAPTNVITHIYVVDGVSAAASTYGVVTGIGAGTGSGVTYTVLQSDGNTIEVVQIPTVNYGDIVEISVTSSGTTIAAVTALSTPPLSTGTVSTGYAYDTWFSVDNGANALVYASNCIFFTTLTADTTTKPAAGNIVNYVVANNAVVAVVITN